MLVSREIEKDLCNYSRVFMSTGKVGNLTLRKFNDCEIREDGLKRVIKSFSIYKDTFRTEQ